MKKCLSQALKKIGMHACARDLVALESGCARNLRFTSAPSSNLCARFPGF